MPRPIREREEQPEAKGAEELWRSVSLCDGYEVSSRGRVRRVKASKGTRAGKVLSQSHNGKGYRVVTMYQGGSPIRAYVHRLVAEAFLSNPDGLAEVNHLDCDKSNNCVSNLEWSSPSGNRAHAIRRGRLAQRLSPDAVSEIRMLCRTPGLRHIDIAVRFGVCKATVQAISAGTIWKHVP